MRKALLGALLFFAPALHAQVTAPTIILVGSAPSGSCSNNLPDRQVASTGVLYSCQSGTWAQIGGSAGATLPFPGLVYATSASGGTVATAGQVSALVTGAINPSSTGATTPGLVYGTNVNKSVAISAWGDSLTVGGQDGLAESYPGDLQLLTTRPVSNFGVGGQTSTQIASRFLNSPYNWNDYTLIWVGRNNLVQATILADVASMVAHVQNNRFLVLGIINNQTEPSGSGNYNTIISINSALAAAYPSNYIDIRAGLISQYNSSNGADVADHTSDIPPYSLRAPVGTGTLNGAINTTACPVLTPVTTTSAIQIGDIIAVDSEFIVVLTFTGNTINTCTRGYGSTAASHSSGASYTLTDFEHQGPTGYQYIANTANTFITAHDPLSGAYASFYPLDAVNNTRLGSGALNTNTTGIFNAAFGWDALLANTTGSYNTAVGQSTLFENTTGIDNTAVGYDVLYSNTTGNYNTATGEYSQFNTTTGTNNTSNGYYSLASNTTGAQNTATGINALAANTTASYNTANGASALQANTTGQANVAEGRYAMPVNTTGSYNVAIGMNALQANTTGGSNVAIGFDAAGSYAALGNSVIIGYDTEPSANSDTNETVIGYSSTGHGSNTNTLGSTSTTQTWLGGISLPQTIYSKAGTVLATCTSGIVGGEAVVSDATALTPGTAYVPSAGSPGSDTVRVQCALVGSTYAWQTM